MPLAKLSKIQLEKDIAKEKSKNHFDKLDKFYKKIPETVCKRCGICCLDSPTMTYVEFMYAYDYLASNYDEQTVKETLKKAVKSFMYGFINKELSACPCLNEDKSCIIYPRAPLACKCWGLASKSTYESQLNTDKSRSIDFKSHYLTLGIEIPDSVINYETPFCEATRVKDVYRITTRDFSDFSSKDLLKISMHYPRDYEDWSFTHFLVYIFLGESMADERNRVIKAYQSGNSEAINQYAEALELFD
jgi:Fe-S-cluster containining protein